METVQPIHGAHWFTQTNGEAPSVCIGHLGTCLMPSCHAVTPSLCPLNAGLLPGAVRLVYPGCYRQSHLKATALGLKEQTLDSRNVVDTVTWPARVSRPS